MRTEVRMAGFGGQGVIKAAILLTEAAGIHQDLQVAQTQSYGPEARGGACRSEVVISDEPIDYIKAVKLDYFLVMSQPAFDKYAPDLDPENSVVLADSTLVNSGLEHMAKVHTVPATALAEQKLGKALFANIIMLGALAKVSDMVSLNALEKCLKGNVPPNTLEANRQALRIGFEMCR